MSGYRGCIISSCSTMRRKEGAGEHPCSTLPYLVPDLEVLALLGAAAQLLVETLVDEAVELVRAVRAVVVVIAEQRLRDALPVLAEEEGVVALVLCGEAAAVSSARGGRWPRSPARPPAVPGLLQRGFLGASSEWSWQSNSPSHSHCRLLRQRPLAQRNSWGPQVGYSAGGEGSGDTAGTQTPSRVPSRSSVAGRARTTGDTTPAVSPPGPGDTHHTPGTRLSHRHSRRRGRRQSAWGCTGGFRT